MHSNDIDGEKLVSAFLIGFELLLVEKVQPISIEPLGQLIEGRFSIWMVGIWCDAICVRCWRNQIVTARYSCARYATFRVGGYTAHLCSLKPPSERHSQGSQPCKPLVYSLALHRTACRRRKRCGFEAILHHTVCTDSTPIVRVFRGAFEASFRVYIYLFCAYLSSLTILFQSLQKF